MVGRDLLELFLMVQERGRHPLSLERRIGRQFGHDQ